MTYISSDLTILVPTLNRPAKLTNLFMSIEKQTAPVGRVIIIDGAESAEAVIATFVDRIPVEYFRCIPPSQIRQRNHGFMQLHTRDRLVALLDDDMTLESNAIEEMIRFWNAVEPDTAGICFNIINEERQRHTPLLGFLGLSAKGPGRVLRSGLTTAISPTETSMRVQWLPGGATVWRKEVLLSHPHREVSSRWAIAEDLIFSYPIGKKPSLYVCASARARHEHVIDHGAQRHDWYHGRTQTIWLYHFVSSNDDLSEILFFWCTGLRMIGKLMRGVKNRNAGDLQFVQGQAAAILSILHNMMRGDRSKDLRDESLLAGEIGTREGGE